MVAELSRLLREDIHHILKAAVEEGLEHPLQLERISEEATIEVQQILGRAKREKIEGLAPVIKELDHRYSAAHIRDILLSELGVKFLDHVREQLHKSTEKRPEIIEKARAEIPHHFKSKRIQAHLLTALEKMAESLR